MVVQNTYLAFLFVKIKINEWQQIGGSGTHALVPIFALVNMYIKNRHGLVQKAEITHYFSLARFHSIQSH